MREASSRFVGSMQTVAAALPPVRSNGRARHPLLALAVIGLALAAAAPAEAAQFHPYEFSFDGSGTTAGQFGRVEDVAVQQQTGTVYAFDREPGVIDKFDAAGNPQNFAATGTSSLDIAEACPGYSLYQYGEDGMAVDSSNTENQGNIYVTGYAGGGVCAFNAEGELLWHLTPEEDPKIGGACGAATDALGRPWIASYGNGAMRYTATGTPPTLVAIAGSASSCRFAVGTGGKLYMADVYGRGVERWTVVGFEKKISENGSAVAFDTSTEHVYVTTSNSVDEYTTEGERVSQMGVGVPYDETGLGTVSDARGVAIRESTGRVYVANRGSGEISVYGPLGTFPDVTTGPASDLTRTSAQTSGEVVPAGGGVTSCQIEWGTSSSFGNTTECDQSTFNGATPVTASLTGLTPGTTYHYRVVAENATGPNWGADKTFTTPYVDGVETGSATGITREEATLHGSLEPNGLDAHYYFEWGTSPGYGNVTPALPGTDVGSGAGSAPASASIEGLQFGTTYHYRLVASNEEGTAYGEDETFETLAAVIGLSTKPATNVAQSSATLNGELDPAGLPTHYYFEWGPDTGYGNVTSAPPGTEVTGSGAMAVTADIEGLASYSTYHYRLVASNEIGTTYGDDEAVTTSPPDLPAISATSATDVTDDSATLSAEINPGYGATVYRFQYGPSTEYGFRTVTSESIGEDGSNHPVSKEIGGLLPGMTYHYRVVAINFTGVTHGPDRTFTTQSAPKIFSTGSANLTQTTATVTAQIYPGLSPTTYHVEYGVNGFESRTPESGVVGSDGVDRGVSVDLSGLTPGTTYSFRVVAVNGIGTSTSQGRTFTTAPKPVAEGPAPRPACRKHFVRRHGKCVRKRPPHGKRRHHRRHHRVAMRTGA